MERKFAGIYSLRDVGPESKRKAIGGEENHYIVDILSRMEYNTSRQAGNEPIRLFIYI